MKKLILFVSLVLMTSAGLTRAQLPRFDSVWVSPPQPVAGQDVGFLYRTTFPAANCHLVNYSLNQNMNMLTLHLYHFQGMLTMICQSQDSIYPGTYPAGTFQLMALLYYQGETVPRDTAWLTFTVLPQAGLEETPSTSPEEGLLWPNPVPAGGMVNVASRGSVDALEVRDVQGRVLAVYRATDAPLRAFTLPADWSRQVLAVVLRLKGRAEPVVQRLVVL